MTAASGVGRENQPLTLPGFKRLWGQLVASAETALSEKFPDAFRELQATGAGPADIDDRVAHGVGRARELKVRLSKRHREAIEAGTAYLLKDRRVTATVALCTRFSASPIEAREARVATILIESLIVYLHGYIDATVGLVRKAAVLTAGNEAAQLVTEAGAWASARQAGLAKQRSAAAHENTVFIRGIDEDGLWEPMLALGLAGPEAVAAIVDNEFRQDNERFNDRFAGLTAVVAQALAQSDGFCGRAAELLEARG